MSEVHALFTIAFPVSLGISECDPSDGSDHTFKDDCACRVNPTPEMMQEFFEEAFYSGFELPLPVFVTNDVLVTLDNFLEEHKIKTNGS